ncbi:DNA primase [Trichloromonas sp.]|uniref:DNA primase n=1 Tax=Trichloromonas sp. TaxID=3069249 RepID=UPI002A3979FB|nr:DNA primase [Trichloromonas sp.]
MTGQIAEETIREIRERTDIVEVISAYVALKRSGHNYLGLCPFHGEKTPSFNVNSARQIFHCFGCGVGGDVFSFLMRMEGLAFPEAVRKLGERVGIHIEEGTLSPAAQRRREERERLARMNEVACDYYHQILLDTPEGAPGRQYLRKRGYDGETARAFRLGFAPERWDGLAEHLARKGFDVGEARELGLIRPGKEGRGDYDLFRNRLLFPIIALDGKVAAFGGRVLDERLPKYLNSPESPLYHKSRMLYGLAQGREAMRKNDTAIVVEGYFDHLALHRAGFANAAATCGTALTEEHGRLLQRYAKKVLLLFDQDRAGRKATFRAMEVLLPLGLSVAAVALDSGDDPDSFLRKAGPEAFAERLNQARPVLEVYLDALFDEQGEDIEGRARATEEFLARLKLLPSEIERGLYLGNLAERTGLARDLLEKRVAQAITPVVPKPPPPPPSPPAAVHPAIPTHRGGPGPSREIKAQDWLLRLLLADAAVRAEVVAEGIGELFLDPHRQQIAERIIARSREEEILTESLLFECLDEEHKAILSGILVKDEKAFAEERPRILQDCRRAVFAEALKRRIRNLDEEIRRAEAKGERERAATCQAERLRLSRELKK